MGASRRVVALLALASVPAVAACQFVLGLDEYKSGPEDAGGLESSAPDGGDGGLETSVIPDVFAQKVSWAEWQMPNPPFVPSRPQDAGAIDANYNFGSVAFLGTTPSDAGPLRRYQAQLQVGDGGPPMVWLLEAQFQTFATEAAAELHCSDLGGRLPSRIELVTLLNFATKVQNEARLMPGLEDAGIPQNRFWTSSPVRPFVANEGVRYWTVSFSGSDSAPVAKQPDTTTPFATVCVEGKL